MAQVDPALLDAACRRGNGEHLTRIAEHVAAGEYEQALSLLTGVYASLRAACARPERDVVTLLRAAQRAAVLAGMAYEADHLGELVVAAHEHWNAVEAGGGTYATETAYGTRTGD